MATGSSPAAKKLLSPTQVNQCKKIASSDSDFSSRAAALLAIHNGASQVAAASQTGLAIGQVRYWVAKFRKVAMAAFPELKADAPAPAAQVETAAEKPDKKAKKTTPKQKDKKKTKSKKSKDKKSKSSKKDKKKDKSKKKAKKK